MWNFSFGACRPSSGNPKPIITDGIFRCRSRSPTIGMDPPELPVAQLIRLTSLFGIGDLTLLGLVTRVGTGTGFTIAQLSLLVNASIGIWAFHVPKPGTSAARKVIAGIVIAGIGGCVIGVMR